MNTSLKKVILLIVGGVAIFASLSALLQSRQGRNVEQELADTRRALRQQGFKIDLADFDVTTDAATWVRMTPIKNFDSSLKLDASGKQLDMLPMVSNDRAAVIWQQDCLRIGSQTIQWSDLRGVLETNREALDTASHAALSGPLSFDLDVSNPHSAWGSRRWSLRHVSLAASDRMVLELHDGNLNAAWTNLLVATRLVTAWKPESPGIFHLIHLGNAELAFQDAWQALQVGHWSDAWLAILQNEWESVSFFTNLPDTVAFDRANAVYLCQRLVPQSSTGGFSLPDFAKEALQDPSLAYRDIKSRIERLRYLGNGLLADKKNLLLYFQNRELELRHAIQSPTWTQMHAQPGMANLVPFKLSSKHFVDFMETFQWEENLLPARAAEGEARRRILVAAIALERYRGKHGAYPATLMALAPEFLETEPVDFMDGQPLRYRLTNDGHFVLYSIGLDCVDDGGKLPPANGSTLRRGTGGNYVLETNVDIVWPRPAAP